MVKGNGVQGAPGPLAHVGAQARGEHLDRLAQAAAQDVVAGLLRRGGHIVPPGVGGVVQQQIDQGVGGDAPIPGAQVVLIPARRERTELFRPVSADSSGHFTISSIAPGEYILASWDAIEPYAFFDPELLAQAERQGKPVRVGESSHQTLNTTLISAQGR